MVAFVASALLVASASRRRHCATCGAPPLPRPCMTAVSPASSGSEALPSAGDGEWAPDSWRRFPALQQPEYPDAAALAEVEDRLARNPPLVFPGETQRLKASLAAAGRGEAFVLQGGDCAETFEDFSSASVEATFRLLIAQVIAMSYLSGLPIVKIGRIAGQFAKPRSALTEMTADGLEIPSFRGDIIHSSDPDEAARVPDPERLVRAYAQSAASLNMLRALAKSTATMTEWTDLISTLGGPAQRDLVERIEDALQFVSACGVAVEGNAAFREPEFYTSHEALLLPFEQALTRRVATPATRGGSGGGSGGAPSEAWWNTSAHIVWVGERTRQLDHAHVEFLRGISNPIGVKVGPTTEPEYLLQILERLNPANEEGRIMVIVRMGAEKVWRKLPPLLRAVTAAGKHVVWSCDPMHENTIKTASGVKTRPVDLVLNEMNAFFSVHAAEGTVPGGIHLEMTGLQVTECLGGEASPVSEQSLADNYKSACDPRLNGSQALEMAIAAGKRLRERSRR
ncbi:hypothetical protein I4F81_001923 [Pyropia yezoensis]|uniref:Uncharacterized protein n=1 Tax=Pyropia yezoensis TaxID=2788 RepID=A0ACC3BP99_PYRYE|nr:hypothetical protein I4F81_001923 [Neopyropia yezoensis]|eukprot:contig_2796_g562